MSIILQTDNLTKSYKDKVVVNKVNMTINKGEIYGFVGENGAGKTTLIRLITGVILPTSGSFQILPGERRHYGDIGAIVENPSIALNLSAYDNIYNQFILVGRSDYEHIPDILTSVGLDYLIHDSKKAGNFSLGMKQRLAIGMAITGSPKLLVLDEPMNGLDPEGIVEFRNLILSLSKNEGITFLISSHILDELAKVANRFGFIHKGKIIEEISNEELQSKGEKRATLKVSTTDGANEILNDIGVSNFTINVENNTILIVGDINLNEILKALIAHEILVLNIDNSNDTIEDYYMKLIGGKK
jgi:ABC-2 type transport system ATP-binding protein